MNGALENILVILASLMAAILIAQTILLLVFLVAFKRWVNRTGTVLDELVRTSAPVFESARELLVEGREKLGALAANINEIALLTKTQLNRVDGFLKDTTERAQVQVVRLDKLVGDTLARIEDTTEAVQRGVMAPLRELTAIVRGVRTSFDFFFNRRKPVERATQDEELFI